MTKQPHFGLSSGHLAALRCPPTTFHSLLFSPFPSLSISLFLTSSPSPPFFLLSLFLLQTSSSSLLLHPTSLSLPLLFIFPALQHFWRESFPAKLTGNHHHHHSSSLTLYILPPPFSSSICEHRKRSKKLGCRISQARRRQNNGFSDKLRPYLDLSSTFLCP